MWLYLEIGPPLTVIKLNEDPLEEEMAIHSSMLTCKIPGQRSLVGCGPWDHKESNMTEVTWAHTS